MVFKNNGDILYGPEINMIQTTMSEAIINTSLNFLNVSGLVLYPVGSWNPVLQLNNFNGTGSIVSASNLVRSNNSVGFYYTPDIAKSGNTPTSWDEFSTGGAVDSTKWRDMGSITGSPYVYVDGTLGCLHMNLPYQPWNNAEAACLGSDSIFSAGSLVMISMKGVYHVVSNANANVESNIQIQSLAGSSIIYLNNSDSTSGTNTGSDYFVQYINGSSLRFYPSGGGWSDINNFSGIPYLKFQVKADQGGVAGSESCQMWIDFVRYNAGSFINCVLNSTANVGQRVCNEVVATWRGDNFTSGTVETFQVSSDSGTNFITCSGKGALTIINAGTPGSVYCIKWSENVPITCISGNMYHYGVHFIGSS